MRLAAVVSPSEAPLGALLVQRIYDQTRIVPALGIVVSGTGQRPKSRHDVGVPEARSIRCEAITGHDSRVVTAGTREGIAVVPVDGRGVVGASGIGLTGVAVDGGGVVS